MCGALTIVVLITCHADIARPADDGKIRVSMICGPRCVHQVLRTYGEDEDLVQLVREMQDGLSTGSSSLADAQTALESRGVHTAVIDIGSLGFPRSHFPAIIHYRHGHFAVIEDVEGGYARVRDGSDMSVAWEAIPVVMARQSGAFLLTSRSEIQRERIDLVNWPRVCIAILSIATGTAGIAFASQRFIGFKQKEIVAS